MELAVWIIVAVVVIAVAVAAITWFGPRPEQWQTHDLEPTEPADPLHPLSGVEVADEVSLSDEPDNDQYPR